MTSEICVMNRRAIVLAADSAVTVTRWDGGKQEERYFKGANKIFQLSNYKPIGLMIFDTADLHRVPWEILVKEFRQALGRKSCGRLSDYAREFISFIESNKAIYPQEYRDEIFRENAGHVIIRHLLMAQEDDKFKAQANGTDAASDAFAEVLQSMFNYLENIETDAPLLADDLEKALQKHTSSLISTAEDYLRVFGVEGKFPPDKLVNIAISALFKAPEVFMTSTGIVIGGYHDESVFPCYEEYISGGFIGEKLYWKCNDGYQINPYDQGMVKAFATTAMVNTFTLGFAPDVYNAVKNNLTNTLNEVARKIIEQIGRPVLGIEEILVQAAAEHEDKWTKEVFERHAAPLRRVVGALPVDEMAELAETLIGLESLKEKVTQPSESVGGPIDVAVISKAEGFVWIKRKHYFDARLNPRFGLRQRSEFGLEVGEGEQ